MSSTSKAPTPQIVAGGGSGALVVIGVWAASLFGLDVPAEVATAAAVLVTLIVAYVVGPSATRADGKHEAGADDGSA